MKCIVLAQNYTIKRLLLQLVLRYYKIVCLSVKASYTKSNICGQSKELGTSERSTINDSTKAGSSHYYKQWVEVVSNHKHTSFMHHVCNYGLVFTKHITINITKKTKVICSFKPHIHWQSLLSKMQVTATGYVLALATLGNTASNRIISDCVPVTQGGQGRYSSDCRVSLLLVLSCKTSPMEIQL